MHTIKLLPPHGSPIAILSFETTSVVFMPMPQLTFAPQSEMTRELV